MAQSALSDVRPLGQSMARGFARRCPKCGRGKIFSGYLKVADECPNCGEAMHHQRADDGPAWLTMIVVGHLMAPALHIVFVRYRPEPWVLFAFFAVACVGLCLFLLPRFKGLMVAFQWARKMHGFRDQHLS